MSSAAHSEPSDRPIIAFFDVDNTLLRGASVYHVARGAYKRGLITVRDIVTFAWHQLSFLWVGENKQHLAHVRDRGLELAGGMAESEIVDLANHIYERDIVPRLWPETVELAREHLRKGHEVWLITATPQLVAQVIADRLGLTGALGTIVESVEGVFTGKLVGHVLHGEGKAITAEEFAAEKNADLAECWAYSDSSNDIPLLGLVGNRVVVNPDARLSRHAKANGWPSLVLNPSSIREAQRRVRREARVVRKSARPRKTAE